jgi:hypothetical protein
MDYQFQSRFLTQGRFAIVDAYFRNILINIDSESRALAIRDVFRGKLSSLVCDLSVFKNFEEVQHKITSHTCLSWQLPPTNNVSLITPTLTNPVFDQTQTFYCVPDTELFNAPAKSLLSQNRQLELQDQMLLYNRILELIEMTNFDSAEFVEFTDQITKIFLVEIYFDDIVEQLWQVTKKYIGIVNVLPGCILSTLKKNLYE